MNVEYLDVSYQSRSDRVTDRQKGNTIKTDIHVDVETDTQKARQT